MRWALIVFVAAALFVLYFFGLTRTGLLSADEPRYAAIGRTMAETGDWVTPRLWGKPWFEKPALLYWMTAVGFKAGLDPDLAPRLPVALASVAFLACFFFMLRREFGARIAAYGSVILATSAGWLAYSHVAVTDLPMSAAFAAAMLIAMRMDRLERNGALVVGALLGVAVLGKGLAPLILFAPAAWLLRHQLRLLLIIGGAMLVVASPWYILVSLQNGFPFFQEFIWKHHFLRFFTGQLLHERPFWYNIPVLLAGLFPWTPFLLLLFSRSLYADRRARFLLLWLVWGLVLFSVMRNKLPGYLLPLLPAIAALLGIAIHQMGTKSPKPVILFALSTALLGLIPAIQSLLPQALISGMSRSHFELPLHWIPPSLMAVAAAIYFECKGRREWAIGLVAILATASVGLMVWQVYPVLDRTVSPRGFWVSHNESVSCLPNSNRGWRYGLSYYAGRELPDCK